MASENKTTPPVTPPKGPSLSDTQARDQLIAVALGQIVAWQMAESKINHDQAGTYAVRYANSAMKVRASETTPLDLTVAKSTVIAAPAQISPPAPPVEEGEKPKSIAEIIGEAEPLEELK